MTPKAADWKMACEETVTSSSISCWLNTSPFRWRCSRCIMDSTMMTAPSTIKPKSIAPRLIKLAETPKICIIANAKRRHNGITDATIRPALKFPRSKTKIKTTINPPSSKFFSTDGNAAVLSYTLTPTTGLINFSRTSNVSGKVYANGVLFKNGTDYTEGTNNYTLATAITNITTILLQQTFARAGAA